MTSDEKWLAAYRAFSLGMAVVFGLVGAAFAAAPGGVYELFNLLSAPLGLPAAPPVGPNFFVVLSAAYMAVVALLALNISRRPRERVLTLLLSQAKLVSAVVSLGFFALHRPYLLYAANGLVDGAIGVVFWLCLRRLPKPEA